MNNTEKKKVHSNNPGVRKVDAGVVAAVKTTLSVFPAIPCQNHRISFLNPDILTPGTSTQRFPHNEKEEKEKPVMSGNSSKSSNSKIMVPEARAAMDKFKMEAANEVGVAAPS